MWQWSVGAQPLLLNGALFILVVSEVCEEGGHGLWMDSEAEASIFEFDDDLKKQVPECSLTAVCPCAVSLPLVPPAQKNLSGKICVFWWSLF